ncbi:hypothetical protein L198_01953 [Cryptococcus wingfieldii CBS 7118]|uniref:Uncharacterized protein n=1 Tax=Cryptococcus wingfieldii CBS 7118 TaxID=1295528 RepID=A0A1E3JWM1_9TREE|nr:hypothetical protein L198_01953 [Cryptococcus wingfieldii CBS 7118]ODO05261.1 hypothetical protein L198_01953 [Cryptococcus wingfieldii CBS 7118]
MGGSVSSSMEPGYIFPTIQTFNPPLRVYRIEECKLPRLARQLYAEERPCHVMVQIIPAVAVLSACPEALVVFTLPPEEREVLSSKHYPESIISYPSIYSPSSPTSSILAPEKKAPLYSPKPMIADPFRRSDPVRFNSLDGRHFSGITRVKYSSSQDAIHPDVDLNDIDSITQAMRDASFGLDSPTARLAQNRISSLPNDCRSSIYSVSLPGRVSDAHDPATGTPLVRPTTPDTGIVHASDLHRFSTARYSHAAGRTSVMSLPPLCNSTTISIPDSAIVKTPTTPAFHYHHLDSRRGQLIGNGRSRATSEPIMSGASKRELRKVSSVVDSSSGPDLALINRSTHKLSSHSLAAKSTPDAILETSVMALGQESNTLDNASNQEKTLPLVPFPVPQAAGQVIPTPNEPAFKLATLAPMPKTGAAPMPKPIRSIRPHPSSSPDVFAGPSPKAAYTRLPLRGPRTPNPEIFKHLHPVTGQRTAYQAEGRRRCRLRDYGEGASWPATRGPFPYDLI